jgi:predicted ATP-grasp superfamily ATP-dependent carboligase
VTRQLIGDASFGAAGFRYCGNILAPRWDPQFDDENRLPRNAGRLAEIAAAAFGLTGVNGIDFIAQRDAAIPVEINPRWTASCELVDRAHGARVFGLHADACRHGRLPSAADPPPLFMAFGKAVVFARVPCLIESTDAWLDDRDIHDVPQNGARFRVGAPVCTVFATGHTAAECYAALQTKAQGIYDQLRRTAAHE